MKKTIKYLSIFLALILLTTLILTSCSGSKASIKEINSTALTDSLTNLFVEDGRVISEDENNKQGETIFFVFPMRSFKYETNDKAMIFNNNFFVPKPEDFNYKSQKDYVYKNMELSKKIEEELKKSEKISKMMNFATDFDRTPIQALVSRVVASSDSNYLFYKKNSENKYVINSYFKDGNDFFEYEKTIEEKDFQKDNLFENIKKSNDKKKIESLEKSTKIVKNMLSEFEDVIKFSFAYSLNSKNMKAFTNIFEINQKDLDLSSISTKVIEPKKKDKQSIIRVEDKNNKEIISYNFQAEEIKKDKEVLGYILDVTVGNSQDSFKITVNKD